MSSMRASSLCMALRKSGAAIVSPYSSSSLKTVGILRVSSGRKSPSRPVIEHINTNRCLRGSLSCHCLQMPRASITSLTLLSYPSRNTMVFFLDEVLLRSHCNWNSSVGMSIVHIIFSSPLSQTQLTNLSLRERCSQTTSHCDGFSAYANANAVHDFPVPGAPAIHNSAYVRIQHRCISLHCSSNCGRQKSVNVLSP
ncbi:hypothetical protein PF006_g31498 [Phytophthora fragariae]|uniref:Uncharacterized protein n=1 Tax=Phytophthora fragariae TaxID=53985 RepID=A0A6A3PW30_9STRA|nr:hypothetical protein PF003_g19677 [Phytophthora fragariae]KAE9061062.1 hypothetical protein PF006_g31498 [Phytophthora fragariae]